MFDKMFEQTQNAFKPMNELVNLNAQVLEEVSQKQKTFINDMISDSVSFAKDISTQKDFSGVFQTQKSYWEGVQEKCLTASTEAYELFSSTQQKAGDLIKTNAG